MLQPSYVHSSASRLTRTLPDDNAVFVHSPYAMEWDVMDDFVLVVEREGVRSLRVEADGCERNDVRVVDDAVVVTEREFAFAELDVPLDAMEQFLDRLHVAPSMMSELLVGRHVSG
jgi:hypothetical protein